MARKPPTKDQTRIRRALLRIVRHFDAFSVPDREMFDRLVKLVERERRRAYVDGVFHDSSKAR